METDYLIYAGIFLIAYSIIRFIMANRSIEKKITTNLQEVVNNDKYKVRGKFE